MNMLTNHTAQYSEPVVDRKQGIRARDVWFFWHTLLALSPGGKPTFDYSATPSLRAIRQYLLGQHLQALQDIHAEPLDDKLFDTDLCIGANVVNDLAWGTYNGVGKRCSHVIEHRIK
jgi:hypothetical protein